MRSSHRYVANLSAAKHMLIPATLQRFHILYDPTFHDEYAPFTRYPASVTPSWLAIFFEIIDIGVTTLSDDVSLLHDLGREK